ncbi:glycerophosphodiester phosphodiesterase [Pedobacter yonginense]|uniref:Altered inheritance of mitochondria protein 6 n=1 Tax=Pedobacter yonginense TaxID=651869 RepID=A0A317EP85_9SPHI|nr:glycerophosphodiester phosphodiesterase [Pedobacter yonginense]PWS28651.1 glycerophosphodiester phosphodiesterase [Pedobacter yonginense]
MSLTFALHAQVKIHSHNDYTHQNPFFEAVENKAFSIEADIFLVGNSLVVSHSRKEINAAHTLDKMYLEPIKQFAKTNQFYAFQLMIDVKDSFNLTYPVLLKTLKKYQSSFARNGLKVSVVISGNRPKDADFHNYTAIMFDGLPNHNYAPEDLEKVVMISDNFATYSRWKGIGEISETDRAKLKELIDNAHKIGKPFRFWNAPDHAAGWKLLNSLGADIINTDQVSQATNYFKIK